MIQTLTISAALILTVWGIFKSKIPSGSSLLRYEGKDSDYRRIALSLCASVCGAWVLFGPVETGATSGITAVFGYALGQGLPLILLAFLGPALRRKLPGHWSPIQSLRLEKGKTVSVFTSLLMIFYMFIFLVAELTGIGDVISLTMGISPVPVLIAIMAVTLLYTWIGGLKSSVVTDLFQIIIILPLWLILFFLILQKSGGAGHIIQISESTSSLLLKAGNIDAIKLGIVLTIGITASNMFHTGFWQRIYICPSLGNTRTAFITGGVLSILMIMMFGFIGIIASVTGIIDTASPATAFFYMTRSLTPDALPFVLIMGILLVMSSMDTLLNGIMSSFNDLLSLPDGTESGTRIRVILLITAITAVVIGARGYSVLYLFLLADLVCSAWVVPLILGIYKTRVGGPGLIICGAAGCLTGGLFFPKPDYSSWNGITPDLLISFVLALTVSALLLAVLHLSSTGGRK